MAVKLNLHKDRTPIIRLWSLTLFPEREKRQRVNYWAILREINLKELVKIHSFTSNLLAFKNPIAYSSFSTLENVQRLFGSPFSGILLHLNQSPSRYV